MGKLSDNVFLEQVAYMMAWYSNFNLKLQDSDGKTSMQYKVWYHAFENFEDDDFKKVVAIYCRNNVYPPSSPTSILDFGKTKLLELRVEEINKAWEELLRLIGLHGYKSVQVWNALKMGVDTTFPLGEALEKHENKLLKKVYDIMSSKLQAMTDFSRMEVLKEFGEVYGKLLSQDVSNQIGQGQLGLDNKKLLKEKE